MKLEDIREYCLTKKCATEELPFGPEYLVFKVMEKVFAIVAIDTHPLSMNLKCDPEDALAFRDIYPAIKPGYHMNKKHWNTIIFDGTIPEDFVLEMIDDSYDLVAGGLPKNVRGKLLESPIIEEFSAGAIIFRRKDGKKEFLLIYSKRNNIWGFPKGHIESGEEEKDAALREIREETGLTRLRFISDFREEDIYPAISTRGEFRGREITKHSIYFLCETDEEKITVDGREISEFSWLPFSEAKTLLSFGSQKILLERAYSFLRDETAG